MNSNNVNYIIRVDASSKIGVGHLMRCLSIADYLKAKNNNVIFLTKSKYLENYSSAKGFKVKMLRLDITVEDELSMIKNLTAQMRVDVIILDINNYNTFSDFDTYNHYLESLKNLRLFIVSFEDFKIHPSVSDILIIPYVGAKKIKLQKEKKCKYMLGPRYYVLRNEFLDIKQININKKIKNILITMGGSDPEGITLKVLEALNATEINFNLKIIIGDFSKIADIEIKNTLSNYKGSYSINRTVDNIAQIMTESDIAIINSGLTKYETSAIGLPSIVISNNKYHSELMNDFATYGTVLHLGPVNMLKKHKISEAVTNLAKDYKMRKQMSDAGKALIDDKGIDRICTEISKELTYAKKTRKSKQIH